ncbi:hypothetical protein H4Q26_012760 [Puccinia striiformis f. sp. tritici PST-130]|nr:hypothetical protein H4Q26_012760 [Puccinia striiformis f. sp. tritici PST-130]
MISKVLIPLVNLYYVLAFLLTNHIVFAPKTPQPPPQPAPQPLPGQHQHHAITDSRNIQILISNFWTRRHLDADVLLPDDRF